MLPFKEIKEDIRNGHTYMEYSGSWYGKEFHIILANEMLNFGFCYEWDKELIAAHFNFPIDTFMEWNYKTYSHWVSHGLYYNSYPITKNWEKEGVTNA